MSDMDETASILAKRLQKVNRTAGHLEADRPIDGPPDREGSPVEHYLSRHAVGGMESVLSGSEEDIHLQSVNIFFERLKNLTEAERLTEPSQARDGKNRAAIQEEERFGDGKQANHSSWQKNIPKLNSLSASGETAVGKETTEPVDTISNINSMKKDVLGSKISPDPAASNFRLQANKSANPETRLFTRDEACTETRVNEATQLNQSHDSLEGVVCPETGPHTGRVTTVEMCTPLNDVNQEDLLKSQLISTKTCSTQVKRKGDPNANVSQSDATRTNKTASQQSSPSASIKRKRRKKRRPSVDPPDSVHGYDRQVLVMQSDSEEEQYAWRGGTGLCLSEDMNLSYLNEQQHIFITSLNSYSATSNLPVNVSVKDYNQDQYLQESIVRKGRCQATDPAANNETIDKSVNPLSQADDRAMSALNNSGNVATNLQPSSRLHQEESTRWPVSIPDAVTGKSCLSTETAQCRRKDTYAGSLQKSDTMNHSINCCEEKQNHESCTAKVKSISILSCAESNGLAVEVSQNDKLSVAKSVLAAEAGNAGRDERILCQREAEPQQQLGFDCQDADEYRSALERTHFPFSESSSDVTKPKEFKPRACPFLKISSGVGCAKSTSDTSSALPDEHFLASSFDTTAQQTEPPLAPHTLSTLHVLSEINTTADGTELAASQMLAFQSGNPVLSGEIPVKPQRETKVSENLLTSISDITPVSSCCTLDTKSVTLISNENITDMSGRSSLSQNDHGDRGEASSLMLRNPQEGDGTSEYKSQSVSNDTTDSKYDSVVKVENIITSFEAESEPQQVPHSKHSVFAMSSFWTEMEKLTINDILGLRMISKAASSGSLPTLQESEETSMFALADSSFFAQLDESKPEQTNEVTSSDPHSLETSSGSVPAANSSSSSGVMWESQKADIEPENIMSTSAGDLSQPASSEGAQACLRKISKNESVHDLPALGSKSLRCTRKVQTLQTLDEGGLQNVGHLLKQDKDMDSLASISTDSYKISLSDIFQYLFSGKQSVPSQSATDNITACYTDGNSVSETYDHFFSDFDTESFFYPFSPAEDRTKDELVPIFSYSRSANRSLQYPETYDHFLASSSSEESSVDSDEEDRAGPVRVVTRFNRTSSASQISTDIYDHFFTDRDLRQNFFWKTTLSFRNISLTGSTVQKQTLSNPLSRVPLRQSGRSFGRTVPPLNVLGNQDGMFPYPLLSRQPFLYEDIQTAVSNPRLDAPLLPLRQSDMCLVCIAFASWVLKTANPQVGDTWKAVLLANVSALSAIRYLRKYVKMEAAASEKNMNYTAPSDSGCL
ncbi:serine-rich adhesin for platelets isoform X2 [Clinocottus analis]